MLKKWFEKRLENLKLWIAEKLNRNPEYCWPELVIWSIFRDFTEIWTRNEKYKTKTCQPGQTYCGKCDHIKQRKDWIKYQSK